MPRSSCSISFIVPACNGEKTILKALASIAEQKHEGLQLIVVDDGSRDSTVAVVEDFMRKQIFKGEFTLLKHKNNLGLSRTLNHGISEAKSDLVLILHQDCEFVGQDWVQKALSFMKDEQVAVVTGYYGISDASDGSFVKRAFGVLRKQFHSRPKVCFEEVTFSEGKCDLYRKAYLQKACGFPTGYRIAGEDLIVSYSLRRLGYKIVKSYDLPVIQRFTGKAETFWGNLGKEFLFGKVTGGVFSQFKFFLFNGTKGSNYSASRSLHRASQMFFFAILAIAGITVSLFSLWMVPIVILSLLGLRYVYYVARLLGDRQELKKSSFYRVELAATAAIGLLTDFCYSFGFVYGLVLHRTRKTL
jgi:glycosyltransferase involved in cell wall biosynthesis